MNRKTLTLVGVFIALPLLLGGLCVLTLYYNELPQRISQHETLIYGQNRLNPGSQAALRVLVRDSKDSAALDGAEIQISLRPAQGGVATALYRGQTDERGTADVSFKVPESSEPNQMLVIHTRSRLGADTVERPVRIERQYRVLLTSDKPLYQPGQVIHLRALALSTFDMRPAAGTPVEMIIADGKGNKVFRQKLTTSEFGVVAADFQLASEVNLGAYKITAELAGVTSEKTINVERYLLPKFDMKLKTERAYYQPGDSVRGSLQAAYFYGKPVSNGQVILTGYTFDVQRTDVLQLEGKTDSQGNFTFEFNLPSYLAGSDLDGGLARFYLQANVTDLARQEETSQLSFPVTHNALIIEAIPEGGQFRPGVDNIFYVMTSYPDGAPAETSLSITIQDHNQSFEAKTGAYGLAEIHLVPTSPYQAISIQAQDAQGQTTRRDFTFEGSYSAEAVLLRPDHPLYREIGRASCRERV